MKQRLFLLGLPLTLLFTSAWAQVPTGGSSAISILVLPTATATVDLKKAPRIYIAKPKFDFGEVDEGPDITHLFRVTNRGHSALTILGPGGISDAVMIFVPPPWWNKAIPPGGGINFPVIYHTKGRPGHATKIVRLSTNDPLHPEVPLQIDMTVVREIEAQPERVFLHTIRFKEPRSGSITILGKPNVSLKILSAESEKKIVSVSAPKPYKGAENRSGAIIDFNFPGTRPIGTFTDEIVVKTNNLKKPELKIPISGKLLGNDLSFSPKK